MPPKNPKMPTEMPADMAEEMPAGMPEEMSEGMPESPAAEGVAAVEGDLIVMHRDSFEELHHILSGILAGLDEIMSLQRTDAEASPVPMDGGAGGTMPPGAGGPAGAPAGEMAEEGAGMEDEEFLKMLMAEGNNRGR